MKSKFTNFKKVIDIITPLLLYYFFHYLCNHNYLLTLFSSLVSNNKENLALSLTEPKLLNKKIIWYANTKNVVTKIDLFDIQIKQEIIKKYKQFLDLYKIFIADLSNSKKNDRKKWSEILKLIINNSQNEIFYDGSNIYITWGWKKIDKKNKILEIKNNVNYGSNEVSKKYIDKIIISEKSNTKVIETLNKKEASFSKLDKLHMIIKKIWWINPILLLVILILITLKIIYQF